MATSDQIAQTLYDYVAGNAPAPSWFDSLRNTDQFNRLWSMVYASRQALEQGMADPAQYLATARANISAVVNQTMPGETALQYGFRPAPSAAPQRSLPDALAPDPERPTNYLDPRNFIPGAQGPAPDLPQTGGAGGTGNQGPGQGGTAAQQDAYASIMQYLNEFNMPASLADWIWRQIQDGTPQSMVQLKLIDRPEFQAEFGKVMNAQRAQGLPINNPGEIIAFRAQYNRLMTDAGLADFFGGNDHADDQLIKNRSINEVTSLINDKYLQVRTAAPEIRNAFATYFGTSGDQALAAFFLNSDTALPVMDQMIQAAQVGGTGQRFGVNLNLAQAQDLGSLGMSAGQLSSGFGQINQEKPLFNETISENKDLTAETTGVGATFGGQPDAQRELEKRLEERNAAFSGGGGALQTQQGFRGLGSARTN